MSPRPAASSRKPSRSAKAATKRLDRSSRGSDIGADFLRSPPGAAAMTAYDTNNVFAKILRGEFPCYKVYENEHVLAFLDIMPRVPGHTLVIPKAPARNILDIKEEDYLHVGRATRIIARAAPHLAGAAKRGLNPEGPTTQKSTERAGGRGVSPPHAHATPPHGGAGM